MNFLKEKTYYKLFSFFSKERKKQLYFLIILLIINGVLEFFSIATVIPVISIITSENINESIPFIGRIISLFGISDQFSRIRLDLVVNILTTKALVDKKKSVFVGDQWRPLLHVKDVANAIEHNISTNTTLGDHPFIVAILVRL